MLFLSSLIIILAKLKLVNLTSDKGIATINATHNFNFLVMKKKSLKVKVLDLAKSELQQAKGGTKSKDDCEEVTITGKKASTN